MIYKYLTMENKHFVLLSLLVIALLSYNCNDIDSAACVGVEKIPGTVKLWDDNYDLTKATYRATDVVNFSITAIGFQCEESFTIDFTVKVPPGNVTGTYPFNFPFEAEDGQAFGSYTTIDLPDGEPFTNDFSPAGEVTLTQGTDELNFTIDLDVKTTKGLPVQMIMTYTF